VKTVFVVSPLRGTATQLAKCITDEERADLLADNMAMAERLCHEVTMKGFAAFAPHVFYPLFLDDRKPEERERGMAAGRAWLEKADEVWVYLKHGASVGMRAEIALAMEKRIEIVYPPEWA
jgi:hypothetical protein